MIITTKDGSHTIQVEGSGITYHSVHGAIQESMHVFIDAGLKKWKENNPAANSIRIFEMGFGTGLNALLTTIHAGMNVYYTSIEKFPLEDTFFHKLNYGSLVDNEKLFFDLHKAEWSAPVRINDQFTLEKINGELENLDVKQKYDVIFFDAFAPTAQPELWTDEVFSKMYSLLDNDGILVTYCSKGDVQRAMKRSGFRIEKIQGPPGKREMIRAYKV
jgi:tRNA U34 5-methylaminomethyl-2-thiouridine-forming methyltransferase MnmC